MKELSSWVDSGFLWLEEDRICYRFPKSILSESFLVKLSENKEQLITYFQLHELARRGGWVCFRWGMVYEQQVSRSTYVYLLKEEKGWIVWRGTWVKVRGKTMRTPLKEKLVGENLSFDEALVKGNEYIKWWRHKNHG